MKWETRMNKLLSSVTSMSIMWCTHVHLPPPQIHILNPRFIKCTARWHLVGRCGHFSSRCNDAKDVQAQECLQTRFYALIAPRFFCFSRNLRNNSFVSRADTVRKWTKWQKKLCKFSWMLFWLHCRWHKNFCSKIFLFSTCHK